MFNGTQFLVKWQDYHRQDSTWEPAAHLSPELVNSYLSPPVSDVRLQFAAGVFENATQQRLSSKQSKISFSFELDVYRYFFGTDKSVIISSSAELEKLRLTPNWNYRLKSIGIGLQLCFPV